MTVGGMDADFERTGKYLQRVIGEAYPFQHLLNTNYKSSQNQ